MGAPVMIWDHPAQEHYYAGLADGVMDPGASFGSSPGVALPPPGPRLPGSRSAAFLSLHCRTRVHPLFTTVFLTSRHSRCKSRVFGPVVPG